MIKFVHSFLICFSMYSAIPMPKIDWDKGSMKYVFCFFPLVGLVIGGLEYLWFIYANTLSLNGFLYAAVATIIPVIISGGIHVDGFIDTCDAIFSYGDKEKKLQILKDPHVGAFGIIYCIVYFVLMLGLYSQIFTDFRTPLMLIVIFAISRGISGFITIHWKSAKTSGLKHIFSEGTSKSVVTAISALWIVALFTVIALTDIFVFLFELIGLIIFYVWFYFSSLKLFDGITGDLVGFSLCIAELILLIGCVLGGVLR